MKNAFRGVGPALITPFNEDLSIDFESLGQLIDFQITSGVDFVVALGTTAESVTMSHEERHLVYQFIKKRINGRVPLMVGFGGNNTAEVVRHIQTADLGGVDGILSVVPYYNKPNQEGLFRHFMAIAEASPVPIVLYNVPSRSGVNMTAETVCRLVRASDKFVAVKEASGDVSQMINIIENTPDTFDLLSGDDAIIDKVSSIGGVGVISVLANSHPEELVHLTKLSRSQSPNSQSEQQKYLKLIDLLFEEGNPAGVKAVLAQQGRIKNILRLPLCEVSNDLYDRIAQIRTTI